jgi:outer membrane immunogenic protein
MKKILALIPVLAFATPSFAADAVVDYVPEPAAAAYNWSGFYIGVNGGYGGGDFEHPFYVDAEVDGPDFVQRILEGSLDFTAGGFVGGAQAGYNFQHGAFVFGVEADIQASGIKGEVSGNINIPAGAFGNPVAIGGDAEIGTELDYFGTVRARLGYVPVERLLVYATGGFAYGRTESYINVSAGGSSFIDESVKNDRMGWTVGGGAEYAFTDNWSLKSEYLYTDLGSEEILGGDITEGLSGALDSDVAFHTVRVGLNYKF